MTENIYDLANQLERAIRALPEYQAVLAAKAAIAHDEETSALWDAFVAMQTEIQELVQSGQTPGPEDQERMNALIARIEANLSLKTYFDQQQRLYVYIADMEKIIFAPIKELGE